jgi:hypothetical protein
MRLAQRMTAAQGDALVHVFGTPAARELLLTLREAQGAQRQ